MDRPSAGGGAIVMVGIVGLGQMGSGMAASLLRAGFTVLGHDVDA